MQKNILQINEKINDFTVISEPYKKNNIWYVNVKCKCGNVQSRTTGSKKRWTKCKKCNGADNYRKHQAGDKKHNLTLIKYLPYDGCHVKVLVSCVCGNIFETTSNLFGTTKSCRECYNIQNSGTKHSSYKGTNNVSKTYFSQIKTNAQKRNITFNLTINYLDKLIQSQNFKCYLSGMDISVNKKTASLDRIDSSKGYTKNNVAWCHKDINRIKSNLPNEYFINLCKQVSDTHFDRSV